MAIEEYRHIGEDDAERLGGILKAVSHPLRLRIVNYLCAGPCTVSQLCEALDTRQSLVSQHLAPLRLLEVVRVDRSGGRATYSLAQPQLRNLIDCLASCER